TLRIWERKKLIKPSRIGKNRFYSKCDLDRLEYIKELLQEKRINIEGVKNILDTTRCWDVKKCKPKEKNACPVYLKYSGA
ncbi:MAG: MerR family transcriptional regulator, partial [Candidatus Omnitrophica bacterium]|nr:MerR family transcriptional regulator [Candidatus Omnitrophota bacterium]